MIVCFTKIFTSKNPPLFADNGLGYLPSNIKNICIFKIKLYYYINELLVINIMNPSHITVNSLSILLVLLVYCFVYYFFVVTFSIKNTIPFSSSSLDEIPYI